MGIGSRILDLRKAHGMTQTELGQKIGVQRAAIQKYESGLVENIPLKSVELLAEVLGVTPSYLLGWQQKEATLADEVKALHAVQEAFGKESVELLEIFNELPRTHQRKLVDWLQEGISLIHNLKGDN